MNKKPFLTNTQDQVVFYTAADGKVMANVWFANDTLTLRKRVGIRTEAKALGVET